MEGLRDSIAALRDFVRRARIGVEEATTELTTDGEEETEYVIKNTKSNL